MYLCRMERLCEILAMLGILLMLSAVMLPAFGQPAVIAIALISGLIGYHARGALRIILNELQRR
jgi:hypothetical protein